MPTRRELLSLSAALPVAALLGGCADGPDPSAAWRDPGEGETDIRRWALAHAILAPNPHDRQPWLVQLVGQDSLVLRPDLTRLLPATDPFDRQITLGCGAFLALLGMAAAEKGWRVETALWPEGEPQPRLDARPIARVRFVPDVAAPRDPLFAHVLARRTNRTEYDRDRPVPASALTALGAAATSGVTYGATADPTRRARLRALVGQAYAIECEAPAPNRENADALRIGAAEIAKHRDGIALRGPVIEIGHALGLVTRAAFLEPDSFARNQMRKSGQPWVDSSMAFAWLTTATNTRRDQIAAGAAYLQLNLLATREGLAIQPWSQGLQEYPEMAANLAATQAELGVAAPGRVQMLVRLGYADPVPPAPRRGLAAHIVA